MRQARGFTLIELVVVIVILGVLAVVAVPRLVGMSSDARMVVLEQVQTAAKTVNTNVRMKAAMPSYATQVVVNRDDLLDVDLDGDGTYETRLKWNYLDNTDLTKWLHLDDALVEQYSGINLTYLGFDRDDDGSVSDDGCYFLYTQAQSETVGPQYALETSGC